MDNKTISIVLIVSLFILICSLLSETTLAQGLDSVSCTNFITVVLYGGRINDTAWNSSWEKARTDVEREIFGRGCNITFEIYEDVTNLKADNILAEIQQRPEVGLVVLTSSSFTNATKKFTQSNTHTPLITAIQLPVINNVRLLGINYEAFYLAGIGCGLLTKNGNIGFVAQAPSTLIKNQINAFYIGAHKYRTDVKLKTIYTNSFNGPLLERKAGEILADEYNVDCAIGTGESSLSFAARNIPSMAYASDARLKAGETVMLSLLYKWPLLELFEDAINGTFIGNRTISRGIGQMIDISDYSTEFHYEHRRIIHDERQFIVNNPQNETIFCGTWVEFHDPKGYNGCLTKKQIESMSYYVDTVSMTIPKNVSLIDVANYIPLSSAVGIVITTITVIMLVIIVIVTGCIFKNRQHRYIIAASPFFCYVAMIGCFMMIVSNYFWLNVPTNHLCLGRLWIGVLGFALIYSCMFARNLRIHLIFNNSSMETAPTTILQMLVKGGLPIFSVFLFLLIMWTALDPYTIIQNPAATDSNLMINCSSRNIGGSVSLILLMALVMVPCAYVAYTTKGLKNKFLRYNESTEFGWTIYNSLLWLGIVAALNFALPYNVVVFAILICLGVTVSVIGTVSVFAIKALNAERNIEIESETSDFGTSKRRTSMGMQHGSSTLSSVNGSSTDRSSQNDTPRSQPKQKKQTNPRDADVDRNSDSEVTVKNKHNKKKQPKQSSKKDSSKKTDGNV